MANSVSTLVGLNHLNNYMIDVPTRIVVDTDFVWRDRIWNHLQARVDNREFEGNVAEVEVQTGYDYSGQAMGARTSFPYAGNPTFIKQRLALKRVIVPAGITRDAMIRATGPPGAWGVIADREIDQCKNLRFPWLMEICGMGDGTGRLARIVSGSAGTAAVTFTTDNTYIDFGWENVKFLKAGMWIQIYDAAGAIFADGNSVNAWQVTAVSFGDRNNSTATTGTFTIACTAGQEATIAAIASGLNGATVYLNNTRSISSDTSDDVSGTARYEATNYVGSVDVTTSLPMGLVGIYQTTDTDYDYNDGSQDYTLDTLQGLARSSYSFLRPKFWNGVTIDGSSGVAGTPGDWDFYTLTKAWQERYDNTGAEIDLLLMSPNTSICADRLNPITMVVSASEQTHQVLNGGQYAKPFLAPNGNKVPILISPAIPDNVIYGITTKHLHWFVKGGFDFLPLGGNNEPWVLSMGNRYDVFEAQYGGYTQLGVERCDGAFIIQDLLTNISA